MKGGWITVVSVIVIVIAVAFIVEGETKAAAEWKAKCIAAGGEAMYARSTTVCIKIGSKIEIDTK